MLNDASATMTRRASTNGSSRGPDRAAAEPLKPILVILHQEQSNPGHIGQTLKLHGHALDIRRPRFCDSLPLTLAGHDGLVIFGGPMSANDPDDYIKRETNFIGVALKEEKPFLGVCLGAQMMARLLGARVFLDPREQVEIGYHDIEPLPVASDVLGGGAPQWPRSVYQWHKEGFELPSGATLLARNDSPFPNQAYSVGKAAVGIQFHPEITYAMISRWSGYNPQRLTQQGAQSRDSQMAAHIANGPLVRRWLDGFLRRWVAVGRATA